MAGTGRMLVSRALSSLSFCVRPQVFGLLNRTRLTKMTFSCSPKSTRIPRDLAWKSAAGFDTD